MRVQAGTLGLIAVVVLLVTQSGCAKSIQANAGSKSTDQSAAPAVTAAAAPVGNTEPPAVGTATRPKGMAEASSESAEPAPSLSGNVETAPRQGEPLTSDFLVAKAEPSEAAQRQSEEMRREQAATMVAGLKDVYFGFDSWNLSEEGRQALIADAHWLRANPGEKVTIEGHCDERGTQSYNLVLGEKRAKAVRNFLLELGINKERLSVVSYGKDRPFCKDHDEGCYQQNRRGHLSVRLN